MSKTQVSAILLILFLIKLVGSILYTTKSRARIINVSMDKKCQLFTSKADLRVLLLMNQTILPDWEFESMLNDCIKSYKTGFHVIYPGTRWCGLGNNAKDYNDLGIHREVDMCCREHDSCPKYILRNECKCNICNESYFTCSHCKCDQNLMKCLKKVNSVTAIAIGLIYFKTVGMQCYEELTTPCQQPICSNETNCQGQLQQIEFTTDISLYRMLWDEIKVTILNSMDNIYSILLGRLV